MDRESLPLIAGNWKMHTDREGAHRLAEGIAGEIGRPEGVEVALFPPFPFLADVGAVAEQSGYALGAQNLFHESEGAFTGEVSGAMLASIGCRYVIVGHSERRHLLGETDGDVARKITAALDAGLAPVVCVGETKEQREADETDAVVRGQIDAATDGLSGDRFARITVAYEPVWAIGTGLTATPDQAREVHASIRARLAERFGSETAARCRILYGGSVKPGNIRDLMAQEGIEGALVGGASLDAGSFAEIIRGAAAVAT